MHLPGFLFVLVCFTGFWLDGKKNITARTVIVFGSLLALALSAAYQNALFPVVVNYIKKLDIWNCASLALAFVALLEMVTVNYLERQQKDSSGTDSNSYKLVQAIGNLKWPNLDVISRIAFPVVYLSFIVYYVVDCYLLDLVEM